MSTKESKIHKPYMNPRYKGSSQLPLVMFRVPVLTRHLKGPGNNLCSVYITNFGGKIFIKMSFILLF